MTSSVIKDDVMSDKCYDNMSEVQTTDEGFSLSVQAESVVATNTSGRGQHKCIHAAPSQFPALEVQ